MKIYIHQISRECITLGFYLLYSELNSAFRKVIKKKEIGIDSCAKKKKIIVAAVGFEPTPPKRLVP